MFAEKDVIMAHGVSTLYSVSVTVDRVQFPLSYDVYVCFATCDCASPLITSYLILRPNSTR